MIQHKIQAWTIHQIKYWTMYTLCNAPFCALELCLLFFELNHYGAGAFCGDKQYYLYSGPSSKHASLTKTWLDQFAFTEAARFFSLFLFWVKSSHRADTAKYFCKLPKSELGASRSMQNLNKFLCSNLFSKHTNHKLTLGRRGNEYTLYQQLQMQRTWFLQF